MSAAISSAASGGAIEHDRRGFDDRLEVGKELEPGAFGQPRRALAPPVERCDDTRRRESAPAIALPIAPGLTMPTVCTFGESTARSEGRGASGGAGD